MTVKELRKLLKEQPPDAEVRLINAAILNVLIEADRKEPSDLLSFPAEMTVLWPLNGQIVYVVGK